MDKCEVCGNESDKAFRIILLDETHTFDSFECAIHALAPLCGHCHCKIIGHGVEVDGRDFCCAHCAAHASKPQMRDRVESRPAR
jgi:hypothetical protein